MDTILHHAVINNRMTLNPNPKLLSVLGQILHGCILIASCSFQSGNGSLKNPSKQLPKRALWNNIYATLCLSVSKVKGGFASR
jgi:hypothetical protein